MSVPRPLPPAPSLEYERREAKALLKALRAGDPTALARAVAALDGTAANASPANPSPFKLADAQRVIAREYGFSSWPRLVRYFEAITRQRQPSPEVTGVLRGVPPVDRLEARVERLVRAHAARDRDTGHAFAAWVPRLYGRSQSVVFSSAVTREEAQLVVARAEGFESWAALLDASAAIDRARRADPWIVPQRHEALCAVQAGDLGALERAVDADPALLTARSEWGEGAQFLLRAALRDPEELPRLGLTSPAASDREAIVRWLVARGADLHAAIGPVLIGHPFGRMRTSQLAWLLSLGADPDWVAPNGLSVLEHALLCDWEREAVDLLAARVSRTSRRDALWIAAGLGDVSGVMRWLDARGRPLPEVRRDRPDYRAIAPGRKYPMSDDPSDAELLQEAFWVAARHARTAVMRALIAVGADVNGRFADIPYLILAVVEQMPRTVDALLACGADPDVNEWRERTSARDLARARWLESPGPATRRIAELLGHDPDALRADRDATPAHEPTIARHLDAVLALAADDAQRCGAPVVEVEHLFVGLLRAPHGDPGQFVRWALGASLRGFVAAWRERLLPPDVRVEAPVDPSTPSQSALPRSAAVESALRDATARARSARRREVTARHLLAELVADEARPVARLLHAAGAHPGLLRDALARE
jgi:hypothetical protein